MRLLSSTIDTASDAYARNHAAMQERLAELDGLLAENRAAGGQRYVQRHHDRGKLLPRERVELLLDPTAHFLELSPFAGWGTDYHVGGSVLTGVGVVEGVECMILAHEATVRGGALNPITLKKTMRAWQIAHENRLPVITLVESGGADLPTQSEIFVPAGGMFRELTTASAERIPTVSLVFGNATAGGAYLPAVCDYIVMIKERSKVFLGGPPLVKMATGEVSTDEDLGGGDMHARVSGLADYLASDEHEAIRLGREIVDHLHYTKKGSGPSAPPEEPHWDPEELLGIIPDDPKSPLNAREVVARVVDGSLFEEFKPLYGTALVTGYARVHGFDVGVIANDGVLFSEEAQKAAQFIQLCNAIGTPLVFLHNTTGYIVGQEYERGGIIKDGAKMINAVANSKVPHITIQTGGSYGAGNYGMSGRSYHPRFLFLWPSARTAVMGGKQLAGVLSIVREHAYGDSFDPEADAQQRLHIEQQIEGESRALFTSGMLLDDGIIDPRDTRSVIGICLSACHSAPVQGTDTYGVFRM